MAIAARPASRKTPGSRALADDSATSSRSPDHRKARCVLIVDDDPATRMLCSVTLKSAGLRVLEAVDGWHGLEQARSERPDLVLTDVMMPGLDGFQLAETLLRDQRTNRIPLIIVSGETAPANAARGRRLGALAYLTKPFDPQALTALVARALGRAGRASAQHGPLLPGPSSGSHFTA